MDGLQTLTDKAETCVFCKLKEINELKYGPLYKRDGLVAHYYCVLFSSRVIQNGADDEGILGFLVRDIKNELKRVKNIICDYCSKPNASVYCRNSHCKRKFHFPCGISRKSLHQYKGSFKSFCVDHRPRQKIPPECLADAEKNTPKCVVCYEDVDHTCETDVLWANCCLKNWYHRDCLQKFALSSGYLFKCAICNNRRQFKQWVEEHGIFVPKQDASWELEPNAFSELLVQHGKCDAAECVCPFGREFSSDRHLREWEIILCRSCGSQGIHPACCITGAGSSWECDLCKLVRTRLRKTRQKSRYESFSGRSQLGHSSRHRGYLMSDNDDFDTATTSSYSDNIITLQTVTTRGRIIRSRTERKRKRTDVQDESESKKTAYEGAQNENQESQNSFEKASTAGYSHSSTDRSNYRAYDAVTDDEAVNIEEVSTDTSDDDEEIIVDAPEISYAAASTSHMEETRSRDEEILIIDLTESSHVDDEEIVTVMETYRTIQLSDIRYRVKKEVYVISDDDDDDYDDDSNQRGRDLKKDDSFDDELEIILHRNNSQDSRRASVSMSENDTESLVVATRNSTQSDGALEVNDSPNEGKGQKVEALSYEDDFGSQEEIEVLEVSSRATSTRSHGENSHSGSSYRGTGSPDKKRKTEVVDEYFFIFLEEKRNESSLDRLKDDIKKVIVNHSKRCGRRYYKSYRSRKHNEDDDSHVIVSSDSETEYCCKKKGFHDLSDDDDDDDDDIQIISGTSK